MQENAAQRYIQANVSPPDPREVDWQAKPLPFKIYRNCEQILLGYGGTWTGAVGVVPLTGTLPCADPVPGVSGLSRGQIGQMLVDIYGLTRQGHSIPLFHPMLRFIPKEETQTTPFYTSLLRPVPSGGALFPCELYLLVGPGQEVPAGIYHYDTVHHALDILVQGDYTSLLQNALAHPGDTPPAYTLLLSSYFWKDGFKYGAFSYRLQGLDIGTIISQSEIITHHAGLSTTIHYQFQDKALNNLLDLDPLHESVYAVIEWRPGDGKTDNVGAGLAPASGPKVAPAFGTINASALESHETPSRPTAESIACWPLPDEVHRASLIETCEAFRPLYSLATLQPSHRGNVGEASSPLQFGVVPVETPDCSGELASPMLKIPTTVPLDLWEARSQRRSAAGTFLPTPLTKQQLSQLLHQSMLGTTNDLDGYSTYLQHTSLYCAIHRVECVPAGVYRYQPESHALELVHPEISLIELYRALTVPNLNLFYTSIHLFPVGNYTSGFQVYGDRWYRMQNMEAGIIAQRLYLAAAALNLGCRASLGFRISETNTFLGLSDAENKQQAGQYTSLMHLMIAPERSAHQLYEQSLLI